MLKLVTALLLSLIWVLVGCSNIDVKGYSNTGITGYLHDHPSFSPIVKRNNKHEYQIVWSRSWQPIIYLRAHIEQDYIGRNAQAYVSYASSTDTVSNLTLYKISIDEWQSIVKAVDESIIWSYDNKCDQLAYKEIGIYGYDEETNECFGVIMMDGASISIAISEPEREIGIYSICSDSGPCDPFGHLPRAILKTIGREHEAN
jgi:hypothetical protein